MPLLERVRRAFTRSPPPTANSTTVKKAKRAKKTQSLVYKPGELPPPKYRAPYDPHHQARLRRFSFSDAWSRRPSETKDVSPMASGVPSRRASVVDVLRRVGGRRKSSGQPVVGGLDEGDEGSQGDQDSESVHPLAGLPLPVDTEASPAAAKPFTADELSRALTATQSTMPANQRVAC